jgi:hypothetical protein
MRKAKNSILILFRIHYFMKRYIFIRLFKQIFFIDYKDKRFIFKLSKLLRKKISESF